MNDNTIHTTCPYCGVGCGVKATVTDPENFRIEIQGDPNHPANYGRLCSKGSALADTVDLRERLLYPQIRGVRADWDQALDAVAQGFSQVIAEHGPDAVAFYVSGQLLTEDYYVANKLMKGFIGSANIDTNSRLCMSSAVSGYKRALGADAVPGNYRDFELAELIVLVGSNAAWCHPVLFQRIRQAKQDNPALKIVVIDPRRTASCDIADLHLALKPGSDALLYNGLLAYLTDTGYLDHNFIARNTDGFAKALIAATDSAATPALVAESCNLAEADVRRFYALFAESPKAVTAYSQGINQSSSGTDKANAIINCHLATGRIGQPGATAFSLTGQPNAMGGREVGGLANQLAAHMELDNPADVERVGRFWRSARVASQKGLNAVEMFDAIADGRIKAVWIMATNPVVSLPDADKVNHALQQCPLVVVSDCIDSTDTGNLAHIKLPAAGWGEKDGTVTNSERRISRQRAFFAPSGEAKPDWWIVQQVAQRMGFADAFKFNSSADIFREHAALSAFENDKEHGIRAFNLQALQQITDQDYEQLSPIQWPVTDDQRQGNARLFQDGQFFSASGLAHYIAIQPRPPVNPPDFAYPLILNTGRIRDQWHTMTRTALSARLNNHLPETFVEIHPDDALKYTLQDGMIARLRSSWGKMLARVRITETQQRGSLFVPMHWNEQFGRENCVGALVNPVTDPISGQPESKHTPVSIKAYHTHYQGIILSRNAPTLPESGYSAKTPYQDYSVYRFAVQEEVQDLPTLAFKLLAPCLDNQSDWVEYRDSAGGVFRAAQLHNNALQAVIFLSTGSNIPDSDWLGSLFAKTELDPAERLALLGAKPPPGQADQGHIVCACFNVGEKTIAKAIDEQNLTSVEAIGQCLAAGTGCGSCLPELKELLKSCRSVQTN